MCKVPAARAGLLPLVIIVFIPPVMISVVTFAVTTMIPVVISVVVFLMMTVPVAIMVSIPFMFPWLFLMRVSNSI